MLEFSDVLYGRFKLPDWIEPFTRIPEFVRLRGVRLSNVDSIEFKDLGTATRWEHGIAVAHLAWRCGGRRGLPLNRRAELALAGLLHDVATPPFAHTAEYVIEGFDHELESQRLLGARQTHSSPVEATMLGSSLPQFHRALNNLARQEKIKVDPDEVARLVVGDGELGFLIAGSVDLDNADNVSRGCALMGLEIDRTVPLQIADWLACQSGAPTDLATCESPAVQQWLKYRAKYYGAFYSSAEEELGRQALLQHLMRRALDAGMSREVLVWSMDETLLTRIASLKEQDPKRHKTKLSELVERYQLLEPVHRIVDVEIENPDWLRLLRQPQARAWIERELSTPQCEVFVTVSEIRHGESAEPNLFPLAKGTLSVFKLGSEIRVWQLPQWLKAGIPGDLNGTFLRRSLVAAIRKEMPNWIDARPWRSMTRARRTDVLTNLKAAGDWSFRLSRNESLHAYPSTFVHAIPSSLINSLGLRGELVIDPFGGTGQTAAEVIKYEGVGISADSNTIATLVARARLTPLNPRQRSWLDRISPQDLLDASPVDPPEFEARGKWHHPRTLAELCQIWAFISSTRDEKTRTFLTACFSATIPNTTARRGKQHGFFADNTPLPAEISRPPYVDAIQDFCAKLKRNLAIILRFYAALERNGRDPEVELSRAKVLQLDARVAQPLDYGVPERGVAGIITSPPYLCMADYSLGQRLSYYWIAPDALDHDFSVEIGARRQRSNPGSALESYFAGIEAFATSSSTLLREGGFLATVLAKPLAKAFRNRRILERIDNIFEAAGFDPFWSQWRPIHWHRNQGYQRLLEERVAVHVRR